MKRIFNIFIIGTLFFTSCDKFLDVEPRNQIELDKLFDDELGFQDALTGVYMQMVQGNGYGARMTQTTIENLLSNWDVTAGSVEQSLGLFNYSEEQADQALGTIMSHQYATIASVNAILDNIDKKQHVFRTSGLYEMIKGELLGIRAYIHLDILRLFGPMPGDPSNGSQLAYVTEFSMSFHSRIPYEQYKELLLQDITDAAALLADVDDILHYSLSQLRTPFSGSYHPTSDFFARRAIRMNYYAVKALAARAHLWFGNKEAAYTAAYEVVDAKNADDNVKFRLGNAADFNAGNYVLREEHIFGLYDRTMYDWYQNRYANGNMRKGTTVTAIINTLFGNTGTDIRESSLWILTTQSNNARAHVPRKYDVREHRLVTVSDDFKQIPLLRISEMYLILAETAPFAEGIDYLQQFKASRGLVQPAPATPEDLQRDIIREYRKEFYAEGQGFFAYKRNNVEKADFIFVPNAATVNYVLPLPTVEEMNM